MTEYTYNQKIDYIDATFDENFNAARHWAEDHNTSFEEHVDERKEKKGVLHRYFYIGPEPSPVEESVVPEERPTQPEQSAEELELLSLHALLNSTDWIISKLCEYKFYRTEEEYLVELEKYREIVEERKNARTRLNELEQNLS